MPNKTFMKVLLSCDSTTDAAWLTKMLKSSVIEHSGVHLISAEIVSEAEATEAQVTETQAGE